MSHHLIKFLCVHASGSVHVCVCNLSITIYTCKGQINTLRQKKKNLKTQCNSNLIAPEICVERGFYKFSTFLTLPGGLGQKSLEHVLGTSLLLSIAFSSVSKMRKYDIELQNKGLNDSY